MKKLLFLLLLCSMYDLPMLTSQNQMAIEGTNWIIKAYKDEMPHHHAFTVRGDTLIDGTWYKKVYYKRIQGQGNQYQLDPPYIVEGEYLFGALRDDSLSARTYAIQFVEYEWASNFCALYEEHLLYDFSLAANDTTPVCMWSNPAHPVVIDAVVEEFLWGSDRTVQYFTAISWDTTRFIGGIGTDMGPFTQAHQAVFILGAGMELVDYCVGTEVACNFMPLSAGDRTTSFQVKVYPNPAIDQFTIEWGNAPAASLNVITLIGQTLYDRPISDGDAVLTIPTEGWPNGIYGLQLSDKNGRIVHMEKLVIHR